MELEELLNSYFSILKRLTIQVILGGNVWKCMQLVYSLATPDECSENVGHLTPMAFLLRHLWEPWIPRSQVEPGALL